MKILIRITCLWALTWAASANGPAATLVKVDGLVLVQQGDRFVQGREDLPLAVGARVFVMDNGAARVRHADGCATDIPRNTLYTALEASPCRSNAQAMRRLGPHYAAAIGAIEPKSDSDARPEDQAREERADDGEGGKGKLWGAAASVSGALLYALAAGGGGSEGGDEKTPISAE